MPATQVEEALTDLYQYLKTYAENNPEASVSVSQGDGYVFISFDDAVFFDGNSYTIRPEGKAILDSIVPALEKAGPFVDELKVIGHTAQMLPNAPNPIENDRRLASNRATEVVIYIQQRVTALSPARLIAEGDGQWRPVSPNDTEESRAKNRRVEMVITGKNLEDVLQDNFEKYYTMYESTTGQAVARPD